MNKNTHFIKQSHSAMTPNCDLARNISKVCVNVISKHCSGNIKMQRPTQKDSISIQRWEVISYFIDYNSIHVFSSTSLPAIVGINKCVIQKSRGSSWNTWIALTQTPLQISGLTKQPPKGPSEDDISLCVTAEVMHQGTCMGKQCLAWEHTPCHSWGHMPVSFRRNIPVGKRPIIAPLPVSWIVLQT